MGIFSFLIPSEWEGRNLILSVCRDISAMKAIELRLREAKERWSSLTDLNPACSPTSVMKFEYFEWDYRLCRTYYNAPSKCPGICFLARYHSAKRSQIDRDDQFNFHMAIIEATKIRLVWKETEINDFIGEILVPLKNLTRG